MLPQTVACVGLLAGRRALWPGEVPEDGPLGVLLLRAEGLRLQVRVVAVRPRQEPNLRALRPPLLLPLQLLQPQHHQAHLQQRIFRNPHESSWD